MIENPTPGSLDLFGGEVEVAGRDLLVAARQDSSAGNHGAVYLFDGDSGELELTLRNPAPGQTSFGSSIAAVGSDLLAVGAPGEANQERVYLFDRVSGRRQPAIESAYRSPYANMSWSHFGNSLAVVPGSDLLVVGASTADPAGAVYVFRRVR